jgi:excisionase family DNA binding protein
MGDHYEAIQKRYNACEAFVRSAVVAEHLSLNIWSVYKMAQRGTIPSHKFGKARRFKLSEVEMALGHADNCTPLVSFGQTKSDE